MHANIRASANTTRNECGITITAVTPTYHGVWYCKVNTFKQQLVASKDIIIRK